MKRVAVQGVVLLAGAWILACAACGASPVAARPADAGDAQSRATSSGRKDAEIEDGRVGSRESSLPDAGADGARSDGLVDASSVDGSGDARGPLSACEPVTPPSAKCPATLDVDFMCGLNDVSAVMSVGCSAMGVVGSGEILACCPPCAGTDGGACYR